jgi:transposase
MTVSVETEVEIRRLYFAEHWKRGTIAAQLGVHFDTVARVLGRFGPKPIVASDGAAIVDPYKSFIDETLSRYPRLCATRLMDMLVERGYPGSLRTLRRYVQHARPSPKSEVFLRVETLAGEQSQIDWALVGSLPVFGGRRSLWAFVMLLAYSRAMWAELVIDLDATSLCRSLVRASSFFGGCTRRWLFDNPKVVVLERSGDAVRFHPMLLDLASRYHVRPALCAPRRPQDKGKVERAIRYLKERFFAARSIHSIEQGNAQLTEFLTSVAALRPHPRWPDRSVADVFEDERSRLLALPDVLPETETVLPVEVDKTASVHIDTNHYLVPTRYARRTLSLSFDDRVVRVLDGATEVARHERCWGRSQSIESPAHRAPLVAEKRNARDLKGRDRLRAEIPRIAEMLERWTDAGRNVGIMIRSTLQLLNAYGAPVVRDAVDQMLACGTHDPGAMAILCEQQRKRRDGPAPSVLDLGAHVVERDVIPHDLGGYDD